MRIVPVLLPRGIVGRGVAGNPADVRGIQGAATDQQECRRDSDDRGDGEWRRAARQQTTESLHPADESIAAPGYASRSTFAGSMREARLAGSHAAAALTATSTPAAAANVGVSCEVRP